MYKHIEPNNLEKQNVQRALDIFSPEMIGTIKSYNEQGVPGFEYVSETITFMELVEKRWYIMDVCNNTQWISQRLEHKKPFDSTEDDRLLWLEEEFLQYLKDWKRCSDERQFLSRET